MASVNWSKDALTLLDELDPLVRERIFSKVSWLGDNFSLIVPEPLRRDLKGLYKLRVGDYRVIYAVQGEVITIELLGHRRDIYR